LKEMKRFCLLILLFLLALPSISHAGEYKDITPDSGVTLPGDFYYRSDYRVQWWYFTGHLFDGRGGEFGYELTFFVVGVQKRLYASRFGVDNIYISHFAVTDVRNGKYYFYDKADSGAFGFAGARDGALEVWVGDNVLGGIPDRMLISASDGDKKLDLELVPQKPIVLNGRMGYSRKSEESPLFASLYFSFTDLKTSGTLKLGKATFNVKGKSWFDRELSSRALSEKEKGWDWFSIQLDDGREAMLYLMRKKDGTLDGYSSGTFVYKDGRYRHLSIDDYKVNTETRYRSVKTGAVYPLVREVEIPSEGIRLRIIPLMQDQEFIAKGSTGNYYWEGTCRVEGSATGRAYVEMTGY
jgi:predicted secreted hydrolase